MKQQDWAQTAMILGLAFTVLAGVWKFLSEHFKERKDEREAELLANERQQSSSIRQAVKDGMEAFNQEIRREFREYKEQSDKQFTIINRRIDDLMTKLDK